MKQTIPLQGSTTGSVPLYLNIADQLVSMIDEGTFRTGDRLPSIRSLSNQFKVSINTVKSVYSLLEDRCVIEAKPQSGYYVRPKLPALPEDLDIDTLDIAPSDVASTDLVMRLMQDALDPEMVQFGAPIPAPDLIPITRINRLLSSASKRYAHESVSYTMPPGCRKLRAQIAKRLIKAGCVLNPDEIVITTGATEAVYLALRTICSAGDTVAVGSPLYFTFIHMFKELGLRVLEIPSSPLSGINLEALQSAFEQNKVDACLIISNFNNPLGISLSDDKKKELAALARTYDIPLIEDDINGDLSFDDERPTLIKTWDEDEHVLLCSSFSKTIAPGYRVGWIASGKYIEQIKKQKLLTNLASPSPTQLAIAEFLDVGGYDHHLRKVRKQYSIRSAQMADAVGRHFPKGTRVSKPEGGFTLWVELPERVDATGMYADAIRRGITIAPGSVFSTTQNFNHCLRLNAAFWSDDYLWAIQQLGESASGIMDNIS